MARGRQDERSLSVGGVSDADAPRRHRVARGVRIGAAAVLGVAVLAAACPGIESVPQNAGGAPGADDPPVGTRDEARLVRIARGDGEGGRLVYDKDAGWVSAKCAEFFPRVAVRAIPADYVETERGLVQATTRRRPPLWR